MNVYASFLAVSAVLVEVFSGLRLRRFSSSFLLTVSPSNAYAIEAIGRPIIMPIMPNSEPKIIIATRVQMPAKPTDLPTTFG